jgi:hypothetical protein
MIDTSKYEGHTQGHWAITTRKGTWVVYTQDNGDVATMNDYEDAKLIADAPKLLAEVKRLRMIVAKLEDARIESASMFDRPALFDAVREIYEQRLQDIHQEKREEE